nr:Chain D, Peptide inhibitor UNC10245092 [Homo sapiens]6OD0_E Chain E, Peptide inhibitor UNC10245092 [Homo sapiens]
SFWYGAMKALYG